MGVPGIRTITFQSLFSWSYLSKNVRVEFYRDEIRSFNPYFPGVTFQSRAPSRTDLVIQVVSILIFLELPFKANGFQLRMSFIRGFNPYFPGVTFQSLFSYLCHVLSFQVSILIFLELPFKARIKKVAQ